MLECAIVAGKLALSVSGAAGNFLAMVPNDVSVLVTSTTVGATQIKLADGTPIEISMPFGTVSEILLKCN